MNISDLMKQNNKLRSQLNKDNKKYYEELLVACRMKNTTKKESELEIQLLEILQDLILYQKQGKNFTDVFGNDINKLSSLSCDLSLLFCFIKSAMFIINPPLDFIRFLKFLLL